MTPLNLRTSVHPKAMRTRLGQVLPHMQAFILQQQPEQPLWLFCKHTGTRPTHCPSNTASHGRFLATDAVIRLWQDQGILTEVRQGDLEQRQNSEDSGSQTRGSSLRGMRCWARHVLVMPGPEHLRIVPEHPSFRQRRKSLPTAVMLVEEGSEGDFSEVRTCGGSLTC